MRNTLTYRITNVAKRCLAKKTKKRHLHTLCTSCARASICDEPVRLEGNEHKFVKGCTMYTKIACDNCKHGLIHNHTPFGAYYVRCAARTIKTDCKNSCSKYAMGRL